MITIRTVELVLEESDKQCLSVAAATGAVKYLHEYVEQLINRAYRMGRVAGETEE